MFAKDQQRLETTDLDGKLDLKGVHAGPVLLEAWRFNERGRQQKPQSPGSTYRFDLAEGETREVTLTY